MFASLPLPSYRHHVTSLKLRFICTEGVVIMFKLTGIKRPQLDMIHGSVWCPLKALHHTRTSAGFSPTESYLPSNWAHTTRKLDLIICPVLWPFCRSDTLSVLIFGNTVYPLESQFRRSKAKLCLGVAAVILHSSPLPPSTLGHPPVILLAASVM